MTYTGGMTLRSLRITSFDPATLLRVGLGLVFVYAGALSLADPGTFGQFVPLWLSPLIPVGTVVLLHGALSLGLGVVFLVGAWVPAVALVATLDLALIIVCYGIDESTFTLVGLMFASLALASFPHATHETAA